MDQQLIATQVVESLRKGIPPQHGVDLYSVGNEKLIEGIKRFHLSGISDRGIIRFISGSWGAGKTHFFRQLREVAFQNDCLVSNVELDVNSAALNKFQTVFSAIVRQLATPSLFAGQRSLDAAPFGNVVYESLAWLATGRREISKEISYEQFSKAVEALMVDHGIDIDFKKMVQEYWKTFLPESPEPSVVEQTRGEILQWFSGEGTVGSYRKRFGVSKIVSKENSKLMLQSLARFVRLSGYRGLLILFDEAEQAYSVMRKSALREAHNNLLSVINNIESLPGLFLIYATTPDFYTDPKHGIVIYGALSGRIGKPEARGARALDTIWNLDATETELNDYQTAANKIRSVYIQAYPDAKSAIPDESIVAERVAELFRMYPSLAPVRFWRLLVTAVVTDFDDHTDGEPRTTEKLFDDVMDRLREE
jgi:BREX system ATP-binding protein BrxC/D